MKPRDKRSKGRTGSSASLTSPANDYGRSARHSDAGNQDHGKDASRPHRDSLQKAEEDRA